MSMNDYMTLREASEVWGIGARRINTLCVEGRIEGATRIGNMWVLPRNATKPDDARIKTGKYIKKATTLEGLDHGDKR